MFYLFKNPRTGEIKEIFQNMNDEHVYSTVENGEEIQWQRIYTVPNASIDTKLDPFSEKDFNRYTDSRKGTVGDLMDLSHELSDKREAKNGIDPVKQEVYKRYSEIRNGKEHPDIKAKKAKDKLSKIGIDVE